MRRKLLVLLLVFTITPSAAEVVEWAAHFAWHGDFAHASGPDHEQGDAKDEHGCSTLFHTCVCHTGTLSTPAGSADVNDLQEPPLTEGSFTAPLRRPGRGAEPPPHRPPIA